MRVVSWNVNLVRARMGAIERYVRAHDPDVLCLQETKVADGSFPLGPFHDWGYVNHALFGQKAYHGVAILAKAAVPLSKIVRKEWCDIPHARHVYCTLGDGVELHNFYVPAGGDVADRGANDKFAHKLDFMTEAAAWFARRKRKKNRFILLGDLNVAPHENDVWYHKQLLKVVSHTPIEVEHLARWQDSHDWVDAVRHFLPEEEKLYSWWSYRSKDWSNADKGRRLDHVWVTPALSPALRGAAVHRHARGYPSASDHAPVEVELDL